MTKFLVLLIPAWIVTYIVFHIIQEVGLSASQLPLYECAVWFEQRQIIADHGLVASWFAIIPWAFKYFFSYPFQVAVGLFAVWLKPLTFVGGIVLAAGWSNRDPKSSEPNP